MTHYVFFLDIDDTILYKNSPGDEGTVNQAVRDAMSKARGLGHKVWINTGRAPSYFTDPIRNLPVDGFVCGCGAYALTEGKALFHHEYPVQGLIRLMNRLSNPEDPGIVVEGIHQIFRYRNSYWTPQEDWILSDSVEEFIEYLNHDTVIKANVCQDISPDLLPILREDFSVIHHPLEHYTECCPKGCTKATGMEKVMAYYGLDMSRSVAIGDSENDLDMISAAGIGVAMGQARQSVKEIADMITDDIYHDGAATAIERIIQGDVQR